MSTRHKDRCGKENHRFHATTVVVVRLRATKTVVGRKSVFSMTQSPCELRSGDVTYVVGLEPVVGVFDEERGAASRRWLRKRRRLPASPEAGRSSSAQSA